MIEHCASQCSSMYRPALRARREYVIHRSNWTMIDDVTSPFPPSLPLSRASCCWCFSPLPPPPLFALCCLLALYLGILSLTLSRSLYHTSRGSNPPQAEHRTEGDAQSSWFPLLLIRISLRPVPPARSLSPSFSLHLRECFPLPPNLSLSLFPTVVLSIAHFDPLPLVIPALPRSSS